MNAEAFYNYACMSMFVHSPALVQCISQYGEPGFILEHPSNIFRFDAKYQET